MLHWSSNRLVWAVRLCGSKVLWLYRCHFSTCWAPQLCSWLLEPVVRQRSSVFVIMKVAFPLQQIINAPPVQPVSLFSWSSFRRLRCWLIRGFSSTLLTQFVDIQSFLRRGTQSDSIFMQGWLSFAGFEAIAPFFFFNHLAGRNTYRLRFPTALLPASWKAPRHMTFNELAEQQFWNICSLERHLLVTISKDSVKICLIQVRL